MTRAAISRIIEWDRRWVRKVNQANRRDDIRTLFSLVSRLGDGAFWYALMIGLLLADPQRTFWPVLHMATAGLAATLIYKTIKRCTSRPRPFHADQQLLLSIAPLDRYSFPSGHTLHAVTFTLLAVFYFPMLAWLLIPFSILVGLSRVVLGLHYPSDVIAGVVIGAAIAMASLWIRS